MWDVYARWLAIPAAMLTRKCEQVVGVLCLFFMPAPLLMKQVTPQAVSESVTASYATALC